MLLTTHAPLSLSTTHTKKNKSFFAKHKTPIAKITHMQIPLHNSPGKVCCHPTTPPNLKKKTPNPNLNLNHMA
jgi:hypothetical protein